MALLEDAEALSLEGVPGRIGCLYAPHPLVKDRQPGNITRASYLLSIAQNHDRTPPSWVGNFSLRRAG